MITELPPHWDDPEKRRTIHAICDRVIKAALAGDQFMARQWLRTLRIHTSAAKARRRRRRVAR